MTDSPAAPAADQVPGPIPGLAVIVPCYRETAHILDVLASIGPQVAAIFVVDDACPDGTGALVREKCADPRVTVLVHDTNAGVGAAMKTGYRAALAAGARVMVKMDGDGQMDPALIPDIAAPVLSGRADYAKGNRFYDLENLADMPRHRLVGNLVLSFASKLSSGYWDLFDPTNGFTALHAKAAGLLPLDKISDGYFFESDILFRLYTIRAVVAEVPMAARYGSETSTLKVRHVLGTFFRRHVVNTVKRLFYSYYLRDFTAASVQLVLGWAFLLFGLVFGAVKWWHSVATGVPATTGTVFLAALPIILGNQFLIAFLDHDTRNMPRRPLQDGS